MTMHARWGLLAGILLCFTANAARGGEHAEQTVNDAQAVLGEIMAIPGKRVPADILKDAHGVAIVPNVIKIGFIGGVRRGHGVLLVKDKEGDWGLPQFITVTGGSVGWQAGAQATDVILVFKTQKSVDGILKGKFTIGADAAAAAGPVGRNAAAATDAQLKAEILSYSRSRGLFAGVSIDGSAIEVDPTACAAYYGSLPGQLPRQMPQSAVKLVKSVAELTGGDVKVPGGKEAEPATSSDGLAQLRGALAKASTDLNRLLQPEWQRYLALPSGVYDGKDTPTVEALDAAIGNFRRIATERPYATLAARPEFQATYELLLEYRGAVGSTAGKIALPPPPSATSGAIEFPKASSIENQPRR